MNGMYLGETAGLSDNQETLEQNEEKAAVDKKENELYTSMPNYEKAVTPVEKFTKYSLNPDNPRADGKPESYRRGLGYTAENAEGLIRQIHEYVTSGNKPYEVEQAEYGVKYKFRIPVHGPNGKTKNVIAVYQIDNGKKIPRMVTNYLEAKK